MLRKKNILLITILILSVLLVTGCTSLFPKPTKSVISGRVLIPPTAKALSRDVSGWVPAAGAEVTIVDANGVKHTVITDAKGYYAFENIEVKANTVVTATVTVDGKTMILKTVIEKAVGKDQTHDTKEMTPESTALALVVEQLLAEGAPVDLDEIRATEAFLELVEKVDEVLKEQGNVTEDPGVADAAFDAADEVINPPAPPAPTPPDGGGGTTTPKVSAITITTVPADVSALANDAEVTVTLTTATEGADIYYTLDGTAPSKTNGKEYTAEFNVTTENPFGETVTLKAVAVKDGYNDSAVATLDIVFGVATDKPVYNDTKKEGYDTIQAAIEAASDGDTIIVGPGEYDVVHKEDGAFKNYLWVNKKVTIKAADMENKPVLKAKWEIGYGKSSHQQATVEITADDVTLEGLVIHSIEDYGDFAKVVEVTGANNFTIRDCDIQSTTDDDTSIYLNGEGIGKYTIENNTMIGGIVPANGAGNGNGGSQSLIKGNTIGASISFTGHTSSGWDNTSFTVYPTIENNHIGGLDLGDEGRMLINSRDLDEEKLITDEQMNSILNNNTFPPGKVTIIKDQYDATSQYYHGTYRKRLMLNPES